jgi:hypothetical protein
MQVGIEKSAGYAAKKSFFISVLIVLVAGICATAEAKTVYAITNHGSGTIKAYPIQGSQLGYPYAQAAIWGGAIDVTVDSQRKLLFLTIEDGGIVCADANTLVQKGGLATADMAGIAADELRQRVYAVERGNNQLHIYTWDGNQLVSMGQVTLANLGGDGAYGIALDKFSRRLYVANNTATVHYYDADDPGWAHLGSRNVGYAAMDIDVDPYHGYLYIGGYQEYNSSYTYLVKHDIGADPNVLNPNTSQDIGTMVVGVAVDPVSGLVYVTTWDGQIRVYDCSGYPFIQTYSEFNGYGPAGICVESPGGLSLNKEDHVTDCVTPGREITFTISYSYPNGPDLPEIDNAVLIDELPAGMDWAGNVADSPAGVYDPNTRTVTWQLNNIYYGDSGSVNFKVIVSPKAEPGIPLHNVAEVHVGQKLIAQTPEDTPVCCWGENPSSIYVDVSAKGNNTGVSWADAYTDLADAIERAKISTCAENFNIFVAQGTYEPNNTPGQTFVLPE